MRKIICLAMTVLLIALSGCSGPMPEQAVTGFLDASKKFDLETMATYLNDVKPEAIQDLLNNQDAEFAKFFIDYFKSNASKMSYTINDVMVNGDSAAVTVSIKHIDGAPLLEATVGEAFIQILPLAFSGQQLTDEETGRIMTEAMTKQMSLIEDTYIEKTVIIDCIKRDNKWLIDKPSDELLNALMSNFLTASEQIGNSFGSNDQTNDAPGGKTILEQAKEENLNVIEKTVGDEITFATIKLKVNSVEEVQMIKAEYSEPTYAREGAKFVIVNMDITNITKSSFPFSPDLIVIDDWEREFNSYSNAIGSIDKYLDYRDLAPSLKENSNLVYELPSESDSYYFWIAKGGTNEVYKIMLK